MTLIMNRKPNIAAYVWPSYHMDPRSRIFWDKGIGEWQTVLSAQPKFEGHIQPRLPLWGCVNEADPYVMEMEIAAAADHGINTFIYDWYWYDKRPFLEACLNEGFLKAPNRSRMSFYLMWANHNATTLWDKRISDLGEEVVWSGKVDRREFEVIAHRLTEKYFTDPLYYRINNKPVFMIYDLGNLISGLGGIRETRSALDYMRRTAERAGLDGLHLQLAVWNDNPIIITGVDGGNVGTTAELVSSLGFDSLTHYQFVHFTDPDRDYEVILKDAAEEWEKIGRVFTVPYYPHISVGWDNNPRFKNFRPGVVKGNTPQAFEKALRMASDYAAAHGSELITLNSWNEWTETSCLMPDNLYGYGYLEAIKKVFGSR